METVWQTKSIEIKRVSRHVYFRRVLSMDDRITCNGGFITMGERILLIDAPHVQGMHDIFAESRMLFGREPDTVLITHGHGDHVFGLPVWPASKPVIAKQTYWNAVGLRGLLAVGVDDELTLSAPGITVRLHAHAQPLHSPHDMWVEIIEDNVIFMGDTVVIRDKLFFTPECDFVNWYRILADFAQNRRDGVILPGHGDVMALADIHAQLAHFDLLRNTIQALPDHIEEEKLAAHPAMQELLTAIGERRALRQITQLKGSTL